ncbi:hypothetical protein [Kitasatospora sp. NPDC057738]|uniref:hypothetical protein n=1 Tax=Kitasatospora sp. NPDC057738 TaxID=3346233 RepID=UPI0036B4DEAF
MHLTIDTDLTAHYADGWAVALTITPSTNSAHLAWSPSNYAETETFEIRLGRIALSKKAVEEMGRVIKEFPQFNIISAATWEYFHEQNRWRWAEGPWWDAVANLEGRLCAVLDAHL